MGGSGEEASSYTRGACIELFFAIVVGVVQAGVTYLLARDLDGNPRDPQLAGPLLFAILLPSLIYCSVYTNGMYTFAREPPKRIKLERQHLNCYTLFAYGKYLGIAALGLAIA